MSESEIVLMSDRNQQTRGTCLSVHQGPGREIQCAVMEDSGGRKRKPFPDGSLLRLSHCICSFRSMGGLHFFMKRANCKSEL